MVESSGRPGKIQGDFNKKTQKYEALGPFQIHFRYWADSLMFNPSIGGKYQDCFDYNYSVKIVCSYMERYGKKYIESGDSESLARLHNGGPGGVKSSATDAYWLKVKKYLK